MNKLFATYLGRTWTELAERKCLKKNKKQRAALIGMHAPRGNSRLGALRKKKSIDLFLKHVGGCTQPVKTD